MHRLNQEIEKINHELAKMGSLSEQLLQDAVRALLTADVALAREVIGRDQQVDDAEKTINRYTIRLLATNQPVAGDLRFLSAVFRLVTDLERVADLSVNLAWRTVVINQEIDLPAPFSPLLPEMAQIAQDMMSKAMEALSLRNDHLSLQVCLMDNGLDKLHRQHRRAIIATMQDHPELVPWGVEAILAGNHLERIGDHITNICEETVYLVRGEVIRHQEDLKSPKA